LLVEVWISITFNEIREDFVEILWLTLNILRPT